MAASFRISLAGCRANGRARSYGIYFGSLGVDSFSPVQTGFSQNTPIQASKDNGQTYVATLTNHSPLD